MPKELIISGRVQGVFCRRYCSQNAKRLGIRGSASNLLNGTVQIILDCDDEEKIKDYVKALIRNPFGFTFFGRIDDVRAGNYSGAITGDYTF